MAIKKAKFKPPVYDAQGAVSYPNTVHLETSADMVKYDDTNLDVKIEEIESELSNIATQEFKIKNLSENSKGDSTAGWVRADGVTVLENGFYEFNTTTIVRARPRMVAPPGHKIYVSLLGKATINGGFNLEADIVTNATVATSTPVTQEGGKTIINNSQTSLSYRSMIFNTTGNSETLQFARTGTGTLTKYEIKNIVAVDLTETFGAGNEPTKEEMDLLIILLGGWFDGEITVSQKTLANWYLKMIRQNRNAIIALGGTII